MSHRNTANDGREPEFQNNVLGEPTPPKRCLPMRALKKAKAALAQADQMRADADRLVKEAHDLAAAAQAEIDKQEPPKPKARAKAKAKA